VPLTIASFATLDNRFWPEAMAIFHLLRNIGSRFFISLCVADVASGGSSRIAVASFRKSAANEGSGRSASNSKATAPTGVSGSTTVPVPMLSRWMLRAPGSPTRWCLANACQHAFGRLEIGQLSGDQQVMNLT
jgi:hypothetical protein